jgi:hypothetical protein
MEKTLNLQSQYGGEIKVSLEINTYLNNGCMYIGLVEQGEYPEPYGDLTVNLMGKVPDYCGYVDLNNMPELEKFIADNELGEFTGLMKRSGFCEYPLYLFNVDRLRELCRTGCRCMKRVLEKAGKQK